MTNTMMVVMVTSRRGGQVTLPASERTSFRNLNGLEAHLSVPGRPEAMVDFTGLPNSRYQPSPRRKDEPQNELDCSGDFNAAPDIRKTGRQQVAGIYCGIGQRSRYGRGGFPDLWAPPPPISMA